MNRAITLAAVSALALFTVPAANAGNGVELSRLAKIAEVDPRYLSYNVEMVEVTGGRFWAPYGGPAGEVYRQRPPEDLTDRRLRTLARQIGPSYMRVSGTWANSTYLPQEGEHPSAPPTGFEQVLTREQWRGVIAFARAADAKIGVSFAVSPGTRGPGNVWKTDQAQRLLDLTKSAGGEIAWAEYINEPNAASLGRLPEKYSVADYTRDFNTFRAWAKREAPNMMIVGPGGVGEGAGTANVPVATLQRMLRTEELMKANPGSVETVSYHFYGGVSERCGSPQRKSVDKADALKPEWLDLTLRDWRYYSALRDKYEPGKPMWITETAQAACGGSPWAATFLDTFRYVNQLGLLAQKDVKVIFHNTLAASDYSLIDEHTKEPRPNYWAAVLWRRTMGTTVLAAPQSPSSDLRIYSHCLVGSKGGVGLALINLGDRPQTLPLSGTARAWTITAPTLEAKAVLINGASPRVAGDGTLGRLPGRALRGSVDTPGKSVTFVAVPDARNPACD
jgi:heparanase 1